MNRTAGLILFWSGAALSTVGGVLLITPGPGLPVLCAGLVLATAGAALLLVR